MLISFEINNIQEDYAKCLEFIKICEDIAINPEEKKKLLLSIMENTFVVKINFNSSNAAYNYLEQPMIYKGKVLEPEAKLAVEINESNISELLYNIRRKMIVHYHVRVHFSESEDDIINLQYLSLLLISLDEKGFFENIGRKRLTVFLVPFSESYFPFKKNDDLYKLSSTYLRLMAKKYSGVIYGVNISKNNLVVSAIDFRKNIRYGLYLPLILVDDGNYNRLFNDCVEQKELNSLFSIKSRERFGKSRDENPNIACIDFLLEALFYHLYEIMENYYQKYDQSAEKIKKQHQRNELAKIRDFLIDNPSLTVIELCLFAYLVPYNIVSIENVNRTFADILRTAKELCGGLRQVVQNSLQHSKYKKCLFSFYLHQNRENESKEKFEERLSRNYPKFSIDYNLDPFIFSALEIYITDYNDQEDVIDSFSRHLIAEREEISSAKLSVGHSELINGKEKIAVRNFFGEYRENDLKQSWIAFRQEDLVAHVGLGLFKRNVSRCKAALKYVSSKKSQISGDKYRYYRSFGNKAISDGEEIGFPDQNMKYVVPGTQLSLLVPVQYIISYANQGQGQLYSNSGIAEDYDDFANYLNFRQESIMHNRKSRNASIPTPAVWAVVDAENKSIMVNKWKNFWRNKLDSDLENAYKTIFNHNFLQIANDDQISGPDNLEVFIKGLIKAISDLKYDGKSLYVAITNLPRGTIDVLRDICVVMGVCRFPEELQLCICETDHNNMVVLLGQNFLQVIHNAYQLSLEQGLEGFKQQDYKEAVELGRLFIREENDINIDEMSIKKVFPFDCLLTNPDNSTYFEEKIRNVVDYDLDKDPSGYKINNTHMRLGNKVHTESFYEMSFLFYRTNIANRIAYMILRELIMGAERNIDIKNDSILFYGYASYSKAILTSIIEILKAYREGVANKNVGLASYQHNLQSQSNSVQMYYMISSKQGFPGEVNEKNQLVLNGEVKLIQIVPISTTLTTFSKMYDMFIKNAINVEMVHLVANYTVFWICDTSQDVVKGLPSIIEKKYWEDYSKQNRTINTKLEVLINAQMPQVHYFMQSFITWHNPISCGLCYPVKRSKEIPLVETDVTSTVPAQQIRRFRKKYNTDNELVKTNSQRMLALKDCVYYGHIYRRQNHYQYYIDTQRFFYNVSSQVAEWLKRLKDSDKARDGYGFPKLNVIFSPEHNTNVGFAQYVNTYYFNGLAEVVSLNIDKEFRSNFVCEHWKLKCLIETLVNDTNMSTPPVGFYFVDDAIISGETFGKANSFLHSLLPISDKFDFGINLFEKVFVLVDRLSNDTKLNYVNRESDFLSYVHIDISNMRTQGDSCIGCKLEHEASRMFKRSGTKLLSDYWTGKMRSLKKIAYDDHDNMSEIDRRDSFNRMIMSHLLQNLIVRNGNSYELGNAYKEIVDICMYLLDGQNEESDEIMAYEDLLGDIKGIAGIKLLLKLICRPFFTYDFKIRSQVLKFFIHITEFMIAQVIPSDEEYLSDEILENTKMMFNKIENEIANTGNTGNKLEIIQDYLMEGFADLRSNFLVRKETLTEMYCFVQRTNKFEDEQKKNFWQAYAVDIQRLLDDSADETKGLRLEYLYLSGEEIKPGVENIDFIIKAPQFLFSTISGEEQPTSKNKYFYQFCHTIFLQNMELNFDGLEKLHNTRENDDSYFMYSWKNIRKLDGSVFQLENEMSSEKEVELFRKLSNIKSEEQKKVSDGENNNTNAWYEEFVELIREIISEKYNLSFHDIDVALLTENRDKEQVDIIQHFEIVTSVLGSNSQSSINVLFKIKDRVSRATQENPDDICNLAEVGYYISSEQIKRPYIIMMFDNPRADTSENAGRTLQWIEKVFLYISFKSINNTGVQFFLLRFILRDILTFRNKIMRFLERDFSGDIYARYAKKVGENNIITMEKSSSHATSTDDLISLECFAKRQDGEQYKFYKEEEITKWLLLRNYTNAQIAKLFNRSFRDEEESSRINSEAPPLYVGNEYRNEKEVFTEQLKCFSQLGLDCGQGQTDGRWSMLHEVMEVNYETVKNAQFIRTKEGKCYNTEYFRCILVDIFLSAIKYESDEQHFLRRLDAFRGNRQNTGYVENEEDGFKIKRCTIEMYRKETSDSDAPDYLVIRNPVDGVAHIHVDIKEINEQIKNRIRDPLDCADGHLSSVTIKRYIENLQCESSLHCEFEYLSPVDESDIYYFETRLPVLRKEN